LFIWPIAGAKLIQISDSTKFIWGKSCLMATFYSKESFSNLLRRRSASLFRMLNLISQVLS